MTKSYFDSYAIIEFLNGNPNYENYLHSEGITTVDNVMEVFYALLRTRDVESARQAVDFCRNMVVKVGLEDVEPAMQFKLVHKGISYIDAIGYAIAMRFGVKFLTGDQAFRGLPNVEFVK